MSKSTGKKRLRGAFGLWVAVGVLALAYLLVWSVGRTPGGIPQKAGSITVPPVSISEDTKQPLTDRAMQDAKSRAPGAEIKVIEVRPAFLVPGPELRETTGDVGEPGLVITLGVIRDGKLTERMTYRALPPDQVVFVEQKPAT
jgi:hypothetical protein